MRENIKFSIIVPCYNVENYIVECVESVINQTYSNWELLLVNDASTDGTLNVIRSLEKRDKRIRVFDKEHGGLPHTRNHGLQYVTGDYLMLLDGDDYFTPCHLEKDAEILSSKDVDMIIHNQHTNFTRENSNQVILFPIPKEEVSDREKLECIFRISNHLPAAAVLTTYRLEFLRKNNQKYGEQYSCSEDLDFFLNAISKNPKIAFAGHEFYFYRQDNASAMTKNISGKMELDRLSIYKKWFDYYRGKYIGEFDCEKICSKIADALLVQIHVCKNISKTDLLKKEVKRYLYQNRYLYEPNGPKGSFFYAYYIDYPIGNLKRKLANIYSRINTLR